MHRSKLQKFRAVEGLSGLLAISWLFGAQSLCRAQAAQNAVSNPSQSCADDNGGITLPPGFCATVFAGNIGHARQLAVAPNGVVYVNTWSGPYYNNDTPPPGGFLIALKDTKGNG